MRITRRGWVVLALASFSFGIATGSWSYYGYEDHSNTAPYPVIEEKLP